MKNIILTIMIVVGVVITATATPLHKVQSYSAMVTQHHSH
jgi:hypothetical protein